MKIRNCDFYRVLSLVSICIFFVIFFIQIFIINSFADQDKTITVNTKFGPVVGLLQDDALVFKGIPYAAPPVGDLRFAPPKDPAPWTKPFEAFNFSPIAFQTIPKGDKAPTGLFQKEISFSEDCLKLNIWTPASAKSGDKLPVYVFIHGGGFAIGSGSQPLYDGTNISRQGVVVVTINYRLGGLGFWPSETTLKKYGTTGNWGILDQIKALEWVKNNIENFGGDPQKVTIGGESAGSISVSALILSPLAKGLFQQAIMESGTVFTFYSWPFTRGDLDLAVKLGSPMMSSLGLKDDEAGLKAIRSVDPEILTEMTNFSWNVAHPAPFGLYPVLDGHVIPKNPQKALESGSFNRVKILIGFNNDEGTLFIPEGNDVISLRTAITFFLGNDLALKYLERYPFKSDSALELARKAVAFSFFTAGTKRFADIASRYDDVYVYRFEYIPQEYKKLELGAFHTVELPFVFGNFTEFNLNSELNKVVSKEVQSRWINFIKTGDPNTKKPDEKDYWPMFKENNQKLLIISEKIENSFWDDAADQEFIATNLFGQKN
jgi:para-nitrobenzyl esterase